MLVQQKTQVGFDQFQKITLNELREFSEESYKARYGQLQGMYDNHLGVLEGRFAPKTDLKKSVKLLNAIHKGYDKKIKNAFDLKLVPHFIKQKDMRYEEYEDDEEIITFRDLKLRLNNKKSLEVLLESMKVEKFKELIVGFDAAANELHASPEVFSPIFRKLTFLGYKNFTFHAGEDFVHLISGLRMVFEAVEFLEMKSGNRIGHATALGIDPALWKQRLYESKLTIKRGEWLDNLVFVYHLCIQNETMHHMLARIAFEIEKHFKIIYKHYGHFSLSIIIDAWLARKYDPFIVLKWREPSIFEDFEQQELEEFDKLDNDVKALYEAYHQNECIEAYNAMIEIEPFEIFDEKMLRVLQHLMIDRLNARNIAIETLPTSNVRISFYKEYAEHHLWRWLGLGKAYNAGDSKLIVVVGSDDTGIFMTNLRNEYVHIFQHLKELTDEQNALNLLERLNVNGKAFTFTI